MMNRLFVVLMGLAAYSVAIGPADATLLRLAAAPGSESRQPARTAELTALFRQAEALFKQGRHEEAFAAYRHASELDPAFSEAYRGMAKCRVAQNRPEEALKYANKAIDAAPANHQAYLTRGNARKRLGDAAGAIADYDQALRLRPDYAAALNNRGLIHRAAGDHARAEADFRQALEKDPSCASAWINLGNTQTDLHKNEAEALRCYDKATELDPTLWDAYNNRAILFKEAGKLDEAERNYRKALELKATDAIGWASLGEILQKRQDTQAAMEAYNRAIGIDPKFAVVYHNRALLFEQQGDLDRAAQDMKRAMEAKPGNEKWRQSYERLSAAARQQRAPAPAPRMAAPAKSRQEMPAATATPVAAPRFTASDPCRQSEWTQPGVPWVTAAGPTPSAGEPNAAASPALEFTQLSKATYTAAVSMAMEQMRLIYGELPEDQAAAFQAAWAPLFDYPSREVVDYLNRLNPLLARFVAQRETYARTAAALQASMFEVVMAAHYGGGRPLQDARRLVAEQHRMLDAQAKEIARLAGGIEAIGNPPNPLAIKCAHRKRAEPPRGAPSGALALLAAGPTLMIEARGLAIGVSKAPPNEAWTAPRWTLAGDGFEMTNATTGFGQPMCGHRTGDGCFLSEDKQQHFVVGRISADGRTIVALKAGIGKHSCRTRFSKSGRTGMFAACGIQGYTDSGVTTTQVIELRNLPLAMAKSINGGRGVEIVLEGADAERAIAGMSPGAAGPARVRLAWGDIPVRAPSADDVVKSISLSSIVDSAAICGSNPKCSVGTGQGAMPVPAAPLPAMAAAMPPRREESEAIQETLRTHQEAIATIKSNMERDRAELQRLLEITSSKEPGRKDRILDLQGRLIHQAASLSEERDYVESLTSGKLVRTRNAFDEYASRKFQRDVEIKAHQADLMQQLVRGISRKIATAPPEERELLRDQVSRTLDNAAIASGDVKRAAQVFRAIGSQVEGHIDKQGAEAEEEIVDLMESEFWAKTAASGIGMVVVGLSGPAFAEAFGETAALVAWAPTITGGIYGGMTGGIEGGPLGAVRGVLNWTSVVGNVAGEFLAGAADLDDTGRAGMAEGAQRAGTAALFSLAMHFSTQAIGHVAKSATRAAPAARKGPSVGDEFDFKRHAQEFDDASLLIKRFANAEKELTRAIGQRSPDAQKLFRETRGLVASINGSAPAKWLLKHHGDPFTQGKFINRTSQFYNEMMPEFLNRLRAKGYDVSKLKFQKIRNAASAGSVGMDLDLALVESPGMVITRNGKPVSLSTFNEDAQFSLWSAYTKAAGVSGKGSSITLTTSTYGESYADKALLMDKIAWDKVSPRSVRQVADVSKVKVSEAHHLPTSATFKTQESCRQFSKDVHNRALKYFEHKAAKATSPGERAQYEGLRQFWGKVGGKLDQIGKKETNARKVWELSREIRLMSGGRSPNELIEMLGRALE
ncbi:MAG: tetratricopeptide repeat protein [Thermodesulfovibrionales bacterium]